MIELRGLTKRHGRQTVVDDLTVSVRAGAVTGLLGPNGAGKSTTMRLIAGLDRPSAGTALVLGRRYADAPAPLRVVGLVLDGRGTHPGRTARNHLRALAATHGIGDRRVDEVLALTGLTSVAGRRTGGFSLGMAQRLGIAAALLGDPQVLVLDEPVNGLDPEGVRWLRTLLRAQADAGRTVLVSSHLLGEMALTADRVVVLAAGRLLADLSVAEIERRSVRGVLVRSPAPDLLAGRLRRAGARVTSAGPDGLRVDGVDAGAVGRTAAAAGVALEELTPLRASLEEVFLELTAGAADHRSGAGARVAA